MISARVAVDVHRALYEAQPQNPRVEIEIPLRVRRDGGDMVKTRDWA